MFRSLIPLLLLCTACASSMPPSSSVPPCNPGHTILNASLWMNRSAEYRATALGIYASARQSLDAALADPQWVGAAEETANDPSQPPAIILDLDETTLDNSPFQTRVIRQGMSYDRAMWKQWTSEAAAPAIPGAAELVAYARSRGVMPFYISNRDLDEQDGTRQNLEKLGFFVSDAPDNLLLRGENPEWKSDKTSRRALVAASYRVLLVLGDDLNDFANVQGKDDGQRTAILDEHASWWGRRWFMLPNAMYGTWERLLAGADGTPCDQVQRKVEALR